MKQAVYSFQIFLLLFIPAGLTSCLQTINDDDLNQIGTVPFEMLIGHPMIYEDEESTSIMRCRLNL